MGFEPTILGFLRLSVHDLVAEGPRLGPGSTTGPQILLTYARSFIVTPSGIEGSPFSDNALN